MLEPVLAEMGDVEQLYSVFFIGLGIFGAPIHTGVVALAQRVLVLDAVVEDEFGRSADVEGGAQRHGFVRRDDYHGYFIGKINRKNSFIVNLNNLLQLHRLNKSTCDSSPYFSPILKKPQITENKSTNPNNQNDSHPSRNHD